MTSHDRNDSENLNSKRKANKYNVGGCLWRFSPSNHPSARPLAGFFIDYLEVEDFAWSISEMEEKDGLRKAKEQLFRGDS